MRSWLTVAVLVAGCGDNRATVTTEALDESRARQVATPATVVELGYDAEGALTSVERHGSSTSVSYDSLGHPRAVTDALAGRTTANVTASGALAQLVDARGLETGFTNDGLGSVTSVSSPDTGQTLKTFDEAGNLKSLVDARGVTTSLTHDALNRLTSLVHQRGLEPALEFTWAYDGDGGAAGQLTGTTFPAGASQRLYDQHGALVQLAQHVGAVSTTTTFEYDSAGRLEVLGYPSGRRLVIGWKDSEPVSLRLGDGGVLVDELEWRGPTLERMQWHLRSGPRVQQREFDTAGRVTRYPLAHGSRALRYDGAGRIVGFVHEALEGASDDTFTYDALDRLTGFTTGNASYDVRTDATGNRQALEGPASSTRWTTEPISNRTGLADGGAVFDAVGNLLGDGTFSATYDAAGRLETFTREATTTFAYDGFGDRVRKTTGSATLVFVYDPRGHLLGEYDGLGAPVREYVWLGDQLVGFFLGDAFLFVQVDHLGAPRMAIDLDGSVQWAWLSHPFGNDAAVVGGTLDLFALPLRFPGQYADVETGLFHNHHRDYDPRSGRYLEPDPLGLEGGVNPYVYVAGDPVNAIDPDGLAKLNLFNPYDVGPREAELYFAAQDDPDVRGLLSVYGHGTNERMRDSSTGHSFELNAEALANRIKNSGEWKPGMPIRLMSCNVGSGGNDSLVGRLSKLLGVPVTGPNTYLWGTSGQGAQSGWYPAPYWTGDMPGAGGRFITVVPGRRQR